MSLFHRFQNPLQTDNIASSSQINLMKSWKGNHITCGWLHDHPESIINFFCIPIKIDIILYLLKVTDSHSTCICQNIRNDHNIFFKQTISGTFLYGSVRKLQNQWCLNIFYIVITNLILQSSRDQNIHIQSQKLLIGQSCCSRHRTKSLFIFFQTLYKFNIQSLLLIYSTRWITDSNNFGSCLTSNLSKHQSNITTSLNTHTFTYYIFSLGSQISCQNIQSSLCCCCSSSSASSNRQRFASHYSRSPWSSQSTIFISYPSHDLWGSIDIRSWNIFCRSDVFVQSPNISPRQSFKLSNGKSFGIHYHTSLGSSQWNTHNRTFQSHPSWQRHDLILWDTLVISDSSFIRTSDIIVLRSISLEIFHSPIIHFDSDLEIQDTINLQDIIQQNTIIIIRQIGECFSHLGLHRLIQWHFYTQDKLKNYKLSSGHLINNILVFTMTSINFQRAFL